MDGRPPAPPRGAGSLCGACHGIPPWPPGAQAQASPRATGLGWARLLHPLTWDGHWAVSRSWGAHRPWHTQPQAGAPRAAAAQPGAVSRAGGEGWTRQTRRKLGPGGTPSSLMERQRSLKAEYFMADPTRQSQGLVRCLEPCVRGSSLGEMTCLRLDLSSALPATLPVRARGRHPCNCRAQVGHSLGLPGAGRCCLSVAFLSCGWGQSFKQRRHLPGKQIPVALFKNWRQTFRLFLQFMLLFTIPSLSAHHFPY